MNHSKHSVPGKGTYYRPQRSWGKVIFSQASVILLTGGVHGCSGGMRGCSRGACVVAPGGGEACMGYDKIRRYDQ